MYHTEATFIGKVQAAIELGSTSAKHESNGWGWEGCWNSEAADYEYQFKCVFGAKFNDFLREKREDKVRRSDDGVYALDLMSTPAMLCGLDIDAGVAVSLGNYPVEWLKDEMDERKISFFSGNLLTKKPWKDIQSWQGRNNVPGFDLITCRPDLTETHKLYISWDLRVFHSLLNRAWRLLDKNSGVLLAQVPIWLDDDIQDKIRSWLPRLKENNIDYVYREHWAIKLVRTPTSPHSLPTC